MTPDKSIPASFDWAEALTGEMLFVGLLGKLWYQYPDQAWYQTLIDNNVFAEAPFGTDQPDVAAGLAQLQAWQTQLGAAGLVAAFGDLAGDYTRLFIGPGKLLAPPWESIYFNDDRLVFQVETAQVRAWYARFGLAAATDGREPEDHVGLELAFVAHLASVGLAALEAGDTGQVAAALEAQRSFLDTHLLKWGPAWCKQVEAQARTVFYRSAAQMTRGVLAALAAAPTWPAEGAARQPSAAVA